MSSLGLECDGCQVAKVTRPEGQYNGGRFL
jgi:hypothetical protein